MLEPKNGNQVDRKRTQGTQKQKVGAGSLARKIHPSGERIIRRNEFLLCFFAFFAAIPFMFLG
jgi:hypothetical protein